MSERRVFVLRRGKRLRLPPAFTTMTRIKSVFPIWLGFAAILVPAYAQAQTQQDSNSGANRRTIGQRLDQLKAERDGLARTLHDFDSRIEQLESEVKGSPPAPTFLQPASAGDVNQTQPAQPVVASKSEPMPAQPETGILNGLFGSYQPGRGFILNSGQYGEIGMTLIAYVRYLNQLGLDKTYTDSFGRTTTLQLRQDVQLNKVNLAFKGWLFDPDFTFRAWIWTQNTAMGEGAQVVVGGQLGYHFNDYVNIYGGIAPLPSTRSTNWTYPYWLKMDNRTIADEFFRGSYTSGFWADGEIADGLLYRVMIANNLSALGVSASQLDNEFNTLSGSVWWMPTTGEYGPLEGVGDYEYHENLATRLGIHYTRSREDSQEQPSINAFENSQIRLSDGTLIFQPGAFGTDGQIRRATYQMLDANAGFKYRGWSLEGEYYVRWVGDFQTIGTIPVTHLFDQGFQVQASTMLVRDKLQFYLTGSEIIGQYGDPWDGTVGLNWYPFSRREIHINAQGTYLWRSSVGGAAYPYIVGGTGWFFNTDFIITF